MHSDRTGPDRTGVEAPGVGGFGCGGPRSTQATTAFAAQLANAVTTYGLEGIDFDDEYVDYAASGPRKPNAWSFPYLVKALREALPSQIISLYFIGEAAKSLSCDGIVVGKLLDYAWNPWYGSWEVPEVPGMTKAQLAPAAIDIQATSESTATSLAERTMTDGYGVYNTYNLPGTDVSKYLSSLTEPLYGSDVRHTGGSAEAPPPPPHPRPGVPYRRPSPPERRSAPRRTGSVYGLPTGSARRCARSAPAGPAAGRAGCRPG